jgi:ubiquinone biosynthesis protein COQ9
MSLPQNVRSSVAELARLADEMWYLAGDRSVDFSWYTKRATLSAVYASTGLKYSITFLICRSLYDHGYFGEL